MNHAERAKEFIEEYNRRFCKECIHYGLCTLTYDDYSNCPYFKPKSRFVELPCEVGSEIYMLVTRKTHSFELDENKRMLKVKNQHTFIKETYFTKLNFWKVLEDFGKTVFLSREEAENALSERSKE